MFGARPILGRLLTAGDANSAPFTIVVSHDVWRTRFGADPAVVGTLVDIPGTVYGRQVLVVQFDGGHTPSEINAVIREANAWLDRWLGPVERRAPER